MPAHGNPAPICEVFSQVETRALGSLRVSVVGLGTNNFGSRIDAKQAKAVVHAALDHGVTFIDTAEVYGGGESERMIGAALRGRREQAVIATKFRGEGTRTRIREAVEGSLRRLRSDRIDLYQMHNPDPGTPLEETLQALAELVREGKVREIGCSNFAGWQIADADWTSRTLDLPRFVSAQNHYSLLERGAEREVVPASLRFGLGLIPYFPLASGLLTGKYQRGQPPPVGSRLASSPRASTLLTASNFDKIEALERFAGERATSLLAVAIGGLAAMPAVASVIAGATSPDQVAANAAAGAWRPGPEDLEKLAAG